MEEGAAISGGGGWGVGGRSEDRWGASSVWRASVDRYIFLQPYSSKVDFCMNALTRGREMGRIPIT